MTEKNSRTKKKSEVQQMNVTQRNTRKTSKIKDKTKIKRPINSRKKSKFSKGSTAKSIVNEKYKDTPSIKAQYYVFWKPYNVLSQFTSAPDSSADTLASYIEVKNIYPIGRLDRDSE